MIETLTRGVFPIVTVRLRHEHDVVVARQRARLIAGSVGFDQQEQVKFATAVSEIARNAFRYATEGEVSFRVATGSDGMSPCDDTRRSGRQRSGKSWWLMVRVKDKGPGIAFLDTVLDGTYVSTTGMGLGIMGARKLTDCFYLRSIPGEGTSVDLGIEFPLTSYDFSSADALRISNAVAGEAPSSTLEELVRQNQEILETMDALRERQLAIERLNAELAETNRGVLALYAELDDRAAELKRASDYKSRFLSDISHELRTPLTSMQNLTGILLNKTNGELTGEQTRQVEMIGRAARGLAEMVNELLDLARIESGKSTIHATEFLLIDVFSSLRGMIRPLVTSDSVALLIDDSSAQRIPRMNTDEGRLSQILRNLLSNALKFTESGAVTLTATPGSDDVVNISVKDTGVGIARDDVERIFEDFVQVDGPIQRRVRGTGLGLPLTRKLATLLGGSVSVQSELGVGSVFTVSIPREYSLSPSNEERSDG
ncbi:MAG TPA: sensor histidine kinase [Gemmatimonadaceae bacterium]|nr:sensor histidine kinase [Gemmatimonadaceae bacterium]